MPARGTCITCSDYEIKQAVNYMVTGTISPVTAKQQQGVDMKSAQKIYETNCSSCHSNTAVKAPQLGDTAAWKEVETKGFLRAYDTIIAGKSGHPANAGCPKCSDQDVISALKYMLQKGSGKNSYLLW
jgi:cytochrome c5